MKNRMLCALAFALALLLPTVAAAEAVELIGAELTEPQSDWLEAPAEEVEIELGLPEAEDLAVEAPQSEPAESPETAGQTPEAAAQTPDAEPQPEAAAPVYGDPLPTQVIKLKASASKTVYLGVSYAVRLGSGSIKSVKSDAASVASCKKDGTLKLLKPGVAKLTFTPKKGKKLRLTLTVKDAPAPKSARAVTTAEAVRLKWEKTALATGYLAQISQDGVQWADYKLLDAGARSLDITEFLTGQAWFRVTTVLGDRLGGTSEPFHVLGAVTNLRVFCQEDFLYGPTDRMNVTWSATPGATGYEVYRATLPSDDYQLLDTTAQTYYPDTRAKTQLYAYRVRPVREGVDDLPMSDPVTLWSGMPSNVLPPKGLDSDTGIILVVNKQAQVTTAYVKDAEGRYTIPLRHMICSTGLTYSRTRNGTYTLSARRGEWYHYPSGTYIRWPSIYRSGYYFHSPLYRNNKKIQGSAVRRLGKRASQGCIRLKTRDAEWVYKNCPEGTAVYICDGKKLSKLAEAIKPADVKVSGF